MDEPKVSRKEWEAPEWDKAGKVHDWRNYAYEDLMRIWPTFTDEQKQVVADQLQAFADREEW